jgi:hypothetical protein
VGWSRVVPFELFLDKEATRRRSVVKDWAVVVSRVTEFDRVDWC